MCSQGGFSARHGSRDEIPITYPVRVLWRGTSGKRVARRDALNDALFVLCPVSLPFLLSLQPFARLLLHISEDTFTTTIISKNGWKEQARIEHRELFKRELDCISKCIISGSGSGYVANLYSMLLGKSSDIRRRAHGSKCSVSTIVWTTSLTSLSRLF